MGRASSKVLPDEELDDSVSRESRPPQWTRNSFSLTWKASEDFAKKMGGRLMTLREAQSFVKTRGPIFPKEDQWAAVLCQNGEADWVQLGDKSHEQGTSQLQLDAGALEEVMAQAVLWVPEGDDVVAADADATVAGTAPDAQKRSLRDEAEDVAVPVATESKDADSKADKAEKKVHMKVKETQVEEDESKQRHCVVLWKEVKWDRLEESLPWSKAEQHATSKGGRLLSFEEAKKFLRKHGPIYPGENHWAAVGKQKDRKRDFVQIEDQNHSAGKSQVRDFKQFPWWGDSASGKIPWMNVVLWTEMRWGKAAPGLTLESSEDFAGKKDGELLTLDEARTLLEHQGVLFAGEDQWAVVKTNGGRDWVQVGNRGHQTGKSYVAEHGSLPSWDE